MRPLTAALTSLMLTAALTLTIVPAQADTVTDTFDTSDARWSWSSGAKVANGRLVLADVKEWTILSSARTYAAPRFDIEVKNVPRGAFVSVEAESASHRIEWYLEADTLVAVLDGVEWAKFSKSALKATWLRVEVDAGRAVYSTSSDGRTYTSRVSRSLARPDEAFAINLYAGRWSGRQGSGVVLDNATLTTSSSLGTTPTPTPTVTPTPTATPKPTATPTPTPTPTATPSPTGTSAAERYGWGTPTAGSEFTDSRTLDGADWDVFVGPGYQGQGKQTRDSVTITNGSLVITGKPDGTTGAVGYFGSMHKYGRWEARIRVPQGTGDYHPVALLWPTSERWPDDGEIDYFETTGTATTNTFSLHHAYGNPHVTPISIDRGWHTYALEWTPTSITGYLDGKPYYTTTNTKQFPPDTMWHSFQLDWMGTRASTNTVMEVDWLRVYRDS